MLKLSRVTDSYLEAACPRVNTVSPPVQNNRRRFNLTQLVMEF
jgi:hypothetical protein